MHMLSFVPINLHRCENTLFFLAFHTLAPLHISSDHGLCASRNYAISLRTTVNTFERGLNRDRGLI